MANPKETWSQEEVQQSAEETVIAGVLVLLKLMSETDVRRFVEHVLNEARRG